MNVYIRMLWLSGALAGLAMGQHKGDRPPALVEDKVKGDCPASLDWASLRGNVVVISFGVDDALPDDFSEWSEVLHKFEGQRAVFLQAVTGSEFLLNQALRNTANAGCILFDPHDANRRNFKLPPVPRTVVVDELGEIAGYSRGPDEDGIRAVLDHRAATGLSETPPQPQPYDPAAGANASFEVRISSAPKDGMRALGGSGPDLYVAKNQPLRVIIFDLWDTPMARISFPENMDQGGYDVVAHIPVADRDLLLKLVRQAVERRFGLRIEPEVRMQRVYSLTTAQTQTSQMQPAREGDRWATSTGQESIAGTAQTMQDVARHFEGWLNVPVVDDTGLKGKFNYSASSSLPGLEGALEMAHQVGLKLITADRPLEILVVRKVD